MAPCCINNSLLLSLRVVDPHNRKGSEVNELWQSSKENLYKNPNIKVASRNSRKVTEKYGILISRFVQQSKNRRYIPDQSLLGNPRAAINTVVRLLLDCLVEKYGRCESSGRQDL